MPRYRSGTPMVRAAQRELRGVEVGDPDVVVADAGYWHQRQIEAVVGDGMQVLVSPDSSLRRGPRPGWPGGLYDFMRRVLATQDGRSLYRRRQATTGRRRRGRRVLGEGRVHRRPARTLPSDRTRSEPPSSRRRRTVTRAARRPVWRRGEAQRRPSVTT